MAPPPTPGRIGSSHPTPPHRTRHLAESAPGACTSPSGLPEPPDPRTAPPEHRTAPPDPHSPHTLMPNPGKADSA